MHEDIASRELVLISNSKIIDLNISPAELHAQYLRELFCELGSPAAPAKEDWAPARFVPEEVRERIQRYTTIERSEVAATILNPRLDVAGNLVGTVVIYDKHPKAVNLKKKLLQPKCGLVVQPRIGYEFGGWNARTTKIIGFDLGYK